MVNQNNRKIHLVEDAGDHYVAGIHIVHIPEALVLPAHHALVRLQRAAQGGARGPQPASAGRFAAAAQVRVDERRQQRAGAARGRQGKGLACASLQGGTAVCAVSERVSATTWWPRWRSSRICEQGSGSRGGGLGRGSGVAAVPRCWHRWRWPQAMAQHQQQGGPSHAAGSSPTCSSSIFRPPVTLWCGIQKATFRGRMGASCMGAPGLGSRLACACCSHESPQSHRRQPGAQV